MTAVAARAWDHWWTAALVLATASLAFRGVGTWSFAVAVCAGMVAASAPLPRGRSHGREAWVLATVAGLGAVLTVRLLWAAPLGATRWAVAASVAAAVGEEALFRRGLYGWLERWGPACAVVMSAAAFAAVHVPLYGWGALPVDLGAGLVLGWQRWITGGWSAPALTHAAANVLAHI